ncbi:sporulation protein YunB [Alkalicoccobacillus murimartini]|uniref:Sporulation protein YunB n=1 Tax=Alkalicoccobacillus murimartini TaxID=171685 RepID=A0ABT9YFI9_9BACI|nr:sporulation protein YunB [Alkalicoccobacillus murimartini]MDQ0206614.1 sporulation protein YunB [Alkalicoccobacillus murimartini]
MIKRRPIRRTKQKGPLPFRYVLLLSTFIFIVMTYQGIWLIDQKIRPVLTQIAKVELKNIATHSLEGALNNKLGQIIDMDQLLVIEKEETGYVSMLSFDAGEYNRILGETLTEVHDQLELLKAGHLNREGEKVVEGDSAILYEIPLGRALNNSLLADLGPTIPVRFQTISHVKVNMSDKVEPVNINSTRVSLNIEIDIDVEVIIPFAITTDTISVTLPAGFSVINGPVPNYYMQGGGGAIMPAPVVPPESVEESVD